MNDVGTIASIMSAITALLVLYFSRRDKRFDDLVKRIEQGKDEMRCMGSRIDKRFEQVDKNFDALIEELRFFRLEFRNAVHEIESDTIDIDKRLIILETVREESKRPVAAPSEPRVIQRRARRKPK